MPRKKPMPDKKIDVLKALSSQSYLIGYGERISMDPELADDEGVVVGQQVRITRKNGPLAIYTVHQFMQDGSDDNDVRMAYDGRQRVDTADAFTGYLRPAALATGMTKSQLESNDEYGELLDESSTSHTGLVVCAPHGGVIENYTDEQAERVYSQLSGKDVSCWRACGWNSSGAYETWHITSTEISRTSFAKLDQIGDRSFSYGVSFHGYSEADIAVGGAADSDLLDDIVSAIQTAVGSAYDVNKVTTGPYAGTSEDNFINWLTANGGVQIEQPYGARRDYTNAIADAVASVFSPLL